MYFMDIPDIRRLDNYPATFSLSLQSLNIRLSGRIAEYYTLSNSIPFTVLFYPNEILLGPSEIIIYQSEFEFYLSEISLDQSEITFDLSEILFYQSEKTFDLSEILFYQSEKNIWSNWNIFWSKLKMFYQSEKTFDPNEILFDPNEIENFKLIRMKF